jgi:hypothetical protein
VGDAFGDALSDLAAARFRSESDPALAQQVPTLEAKVFGLLVALVASIEAVATTTEGSLPGFKARLYGRALSDGLRSESPLLFGFLCLAGIFTVEDLAISDDPADPHAFHLVETVRFESDRLLRWFRDPKGVLADVYGWGTPSIDVARLYANGQRLLRGRTRDTVVGFAAANVLAACGVSPSPTGHELIPQLSIPLVDFESGDVFLKLVPLPTGSPSDPQQLALVLNVGAASAGNNQLDDRWKLSWSIGGSVAAGAAVLLRPDAAPRIVGNPFSASPSDVQTTARMEVSRTIGGDAVDPAEGDLIGAQNGAVVRARTLRLFLEAKAGAETDVRFGTGIEGGRVIVATDDADGFLGKIVGNKSFDANFDAELSWSRATGVRLSGSGGLKISRPVNLDLGAFRVTELDLEVRITGGVALDLRANVTTDIGPVSASVQGVGATVHVATGSGNAGLFNLDSGFLAPNGVGIAIHAGSVTGGGFLSFQNGTYTGALELKVYSVDVKAFGVVETKLPNGQAGYSFAIVISADFNPIQLGLGFTLNGVGGIIGINRRIDEKALGDAVRKGQLDHLLFPNDVVHNAPQIIHDLQTVLPATPDKYVFGPLAKIGWGTPTLIEGKLGLILEFPGPRMAILGEVSAILPRKDSAIVTLHLTVGGTFDIPKKTLAIDAGLHDSSVGSNPISGSMALRLSWGERPTFLLALGGFNPAFQPPPGFPPLKRVTVNTGIQGNPNLSLEGYFAITSNTAQLGAAVELKASGYGISLDARLGFDALFVFSPFKFDADISASISVSFLGANIASAHFEGTLSGPSPWHVHGHICVSLWLADACLDFDKSFGGGPEVQLPTIDPWTGKNSVTGVQDVLGLEKTLQDVRNWTPEPPPAAFSVVSLTGSSSDVQLFDPLGVAVVKQNVCPFNLQLQRFGAAKPVGPARFFLKLATLNNGTPITQFTFIKEPFAKAQFVELKDSQKLSAPSFEPFDGAIRLPANDNKSVAGSMATKDIQYQTKVLGAPAFDIHPLPSNHHLGMAQRGAAALLGLRRAAAQAYLDPTAQPRFTFDLEEFVVGNNNTLKTQTGVLARPANKYEATIALRGYLAAHPEFVGVLNVYPKYEMGGR